MRGRVVLRCGGTVLLSLLLPMVCGASGALGAQARSSFGVSVTVANTCRVAVTQAVVSRCVYRQPATVHVMGPTAEPVRVGTGQAQGVTYLAIEY